MGYFVSPILCPWCKVKSRFEFKQRVVIGTTSDLEDVNLYLCGACGWPILGDDTDDGQDRMILVWWRPVGYRTPSYEGVPEPIAEDAREAHRCLGADAPHAAATMARRAVQATALALGAPKRRKLVDQIAWLKSEGKIIELLHDVAEVVRLGGNDGAHPSDSVTSEEAHELLSFTDDLLHYAFGIPDKLAAKDKGVSDNA